MYQVVEFTETGDGAGGGISVVRVEWLTPRKNHCLWPPHRLTSKFNKCLTEGTVPDERWEIYAIKRIFYETDDLSKAREKAKQAEIDSEVGSDSSQKKRRRKKKQRIYDSDTSVASEKSDHAIRYPSPPTRSISATNLTPPPTRSTSSTNSTPPPIRPTSANREVSPNAEVVGVEQESLTLGSLDLTVTPFLKEANSLTLDVIAKHLASISLEIKELQVKQNEILDRLRSDRSAGNLGLPDDLKLPCDNSKDLEDLETWLTTNEENRKHMTTYLSFVGGNKGPVIVRRVLEKIFTNKLALVCNWTGKNAKTSIKDLQIIKVIRDAVRAHKIAEKTTDSEIHEVSDSPKTVMEDGNLADLGSRSKRSQQRDLAKRFAQIKDELSNVDSIDNNGQSNINVSLPSNESLLCINSSTDGSACVAPAPVYTG